jgi:signal transduction histidine kinase
MEKLIEGLLALARRSELAEPVEADLGAVAEDAWATVETGDLSLSLADPPAVTADPERLRQLLENLFRNAVEHGSTSPRSRVHEDAVGRGVTATTVTVGALDGGGFYVADDGVGIPEDEREDVLESGYSGGDGTGFGLAIVETNAEAHGWHLEVTESESGGVRFEFRDDPTVDD